MGCVLAYFQKAQCTTPSLDIQKDILVVGSREVKDPASLTSSNGLQEDNKVLQNEDQPDGPSSPAEDVDIQNIEDVPSSPVTSETTLKEIEESQLLLKDNDEQIAQATKETSENEMQGNISPQPLAEELSSIISLTDAVIEDRKSPSAESKIYAAEVETNSQLNSPKSITPATPNESEFTESSPDIQNTEEIQISDTEITNVTEKLEAKQIDMPPPAPTFEGRNPILDIIESPVKVRNVVTVEQAVQVVADDGGTILEIAGPPTLDQVNVVQDYLELDFQDIPQGLESEENVALNEAATRIQATFRGFRTRRQISDPNPQPSGRSKKRRHNNPQKSNTEALSESNSDRGLDAAAAKIQAGFRGYRVRKDMKDKLSNGPKSSARQFQAQSACGDDDDKMDTAAKTIQANVRGFLTRKRLKRNRSSRKNSSLEKSNQMEDSENLTPLLDRENSENISKKKQKFSQEYPDDNKQAADAATKIQAGFRGYKCRRNLNCKEKGRPVENKIQLSPLPLAYQPESPVEDMAAAKIQAGFRGFKTRKELKNSRIGRKKSKSESELIIPSSSEDFGDMISLTCSEDDTKKEMDAATKIQAGFRGYQSRKRHKKHKQIKYPDSQSVNNDSLASELIDSLDADSYAASKAATKIQAGFRGYKVRKEIKKKEPVHIFAELERDINSNLDSRTTRAATKIQAGFRGYKVRKDFNRLPGKDVPRNK